MADGIRSFESQMRYHFPEAQRRFPAFSMPKMVPGQVLAGQLAAHQCAYMARIVDSDKDAIYLFLEADPKKGPCDRETAKAFYDFLLCQKMGQMSSYEVAAGGEYSHEEALNIELLPAENNREFQTYYDEQMAKLRGEMDAEEKRRKDDEFERKMGFRRDDPDIIDVEVDEPASDNVDTGSAVQKGTGTAVGMPKKIFYCVVAHVGSGHMLGYNGSRGGVSGSRRGRLGRGAAGYLREDDVAEMVDEAMTGSHTKKLEAIMRKVRSMCYHAAESAAGDAEESEYDELRQMLD